MVPRTNCLVLAALVLAVAVAGVKVHQEKESVKAVEDMSVEEKVEMMKAEYRRVEGTDEADFTVEELTLKNGVKVKKISMKPDAPKREVDLSKLKKGDIKVYKFPKQKIIGKDGKEMWIQPL